MNHKIVKCYVAMRMSQKMRENSRVSGTSHKPENVKKRVRKIR